MEKRKCTPLVILKPEGLKDLRFLFPFLFILLMAFQPLVFAAHGCSVREPDRDGDGVPDKDDPYPDDPTRGGLSEKYCGSEPLSMTLFFIPFSADPGPVSKGSIEDKKASSVRFCSKNSAGEAVLGAVEEGVKGSSPAAGGAPVQEKMAPNDIRLKMVLPRSSGEEIVYYADKSGVGTKDGIPFRLTEEQKTKIEEKIGKAVQNCGPQTKTYCGPPQNQ